MGYFILLLTILFPWGYGIHEAKTDAAKIAADGSMDSLKEAFHRQNLLIRGLLILLMVGVFTWALMLLLTYPWWFSLAYFTYCAAVFGYVFTTRLNRLRGLPSFYVSRSPRASKTDRMQVRLAAKLGVTPYTFAQIFYTLFLIFGIAVLAGAIVVNLLINK